MIFAGYPYLLNVLVERVQFNLWLLVELLWNDLMFFVLHTKFIEQAHFCSMFDIVRECSLSLTAEKSCNVGYRISHRCWFDVLCVFSAWRSFYEKKFDINLRDSYLKAWYWWCHYKWSCIYNNIYKIYIMLL